MATFIQIARQFVEVCLRRADTDQSLQPIAVQRTPGSLLDDLAADKGAAFYIGARPRFATCGGVAWFHGRYLATVNLLGNAVQTYEFDPDTCNVKLLQNLVGMKGLAQPENLAVSPHGDLMAITNSIDSAVNLYAVDLRSHFIDPTPVLTIRPEEPVSPHGVAFSPCASVLLFSTVEDPGSLRSYRLDRVDDAVTASPVQVLRNSELPLKPKGVSFSHDGNLVAIAYGMNAERMPCEEVRGFVGVYRFHPESGCEPDPVCAVRDALDIRCAEDINFLPDGKHLAVTDQAAETARILAFDPTSRSIGRCVLNIRNPRGRLSFPHGNGVSEDGRFLAVANYGADELAIYQLGL